MASSDQNLTRCKEEAHQAGSNLEDAHRKIESCLLQDKQKTDVIKDLQGQLQKLQMESSAAEEERKSSRYPSPIPGPEVGSCPEWDSDMTSPRVGPSPQSISTGPGTLPVSPCCRKQIEELTSELKEDQRRITNSDKEKSMLQKTLIENERKINDLLDSVKTSEQKVREHTSSRLHYLSCLRLSGSVFINFLC